MSSDCRTLQSPLARAASSLNSGRLGRSGRAAAWTTSQTSASRTMLDWTAMQDKSVVCQYSGRRRFIYVHQYQTMINKHVVDLIYFYKTSLLMFG